MKFKRKGRLLSYVAFFLVVITGLGLLGTLRPFGDHASSNLETSDSEVVVSKLTFVGALDSGRLTAASYANGMHFAAVDGDGNTATQLLASDDGKTWVNVLDHPSVTGQMPVDEIVDEIVYNNGTWIFGFFGWKSLRDGILFRFRPETADNNGLGGDWQSLLDGKEYGCGRFLCVEFFEKAVYIVSENGSLLQKGRGLPSGYVNEANPRPFAGFRVFDLAKCGDTYLALGEYAGAGGTVLFQASSMDGPWTMQRLGDIKANRFDTTAEGVCFIACDDGTVVYSSDLVSWRGASVPEKVNFTEFFAFNGKHYAIGGTDSYGVLYESTTGATWERVARFKEHLVAASSSEDEVFLYGEGGGIYRLTK